MYKKIFQFTLLFVGLSVLFSCKSSFDTVLSSTDNNLKKEKALEYFDQEEYYKAQLLFEQIMPFYRGTKEIEPIYFKYCYTHYHLGKYILSAYYFKNFTQTFPRSEFAEEASYMNAFSNYKLSPNYKLDQTYTATAIDEFQKFINQYPTSDKVEVSNALIEEMRAKQEEKAYASAELYYKLEEYQSANHAFDNLLKDYPDSQNVEKVRYMSVVSAYRLAENSIVSKKKERYEETIKLALEFKDRYAESKYRKEVDDISQSSTDALKKLQ